MARPAVGKPYHLDTHFYPDGALQVQITAETSLPRLRLSEVRIEKSDLPKCRNDQEPE